MGKDWYKSKTMWFGVLQLMAVALLKIFGVDLTDAVGQMAEGLVVAIVAVEGVVIIVLRAMTTRSAVCRHRDSPGVPARYVTPLRHWGRRVRDDPCNAAQRSGSTSQCPG